jgi:hypothetical protein
VPLSTSSAPTALAVSRSKKQWKTIPSVSKTKINRTNPLTKGLIRAYAFNENSGRIVTDYVRGFDGLAGNQITKADWEKFKARNVEGGAVNLDATDQNNNWVDCGKMSESRNAKQLTLIFWAYRTSVSDQLRVGMANNTFTSTWGIAVYTDGRVYADLCDTAGTNRAGYYTASPSGWHCYAMVFDGTQATDATRLKQYLDGVEQTLTYNGTIGDHVLDVDDNFGIGKQGQSHSVGKHGLTLVYNRALSAKEISAVYNNPHSIFSDYEVMDWATPINPIRPIAKSKKPWIEQPSLLTSIDWTHSINKELRGKWMLNEGKGAKVIDIARGNHGIFAGNAAWVNNVDGRKKAVVFSRTGGSDLINCGAKSHVNNLNPVRLGLPN